MKVFECKIIKLSVFLGLIFLFGQTAFAQENKCAQSDSDEKIMECLYQQYVDNFQSKDPEKLKIALEAAKEYVKKCENFDNCEPASPETQYFRDAIATLENKLKSESANFESGK